MEDAIFFATHTAGRARLVPGDALKDHAALVGLSFRGAWNGRGRTVSAVAAAASTPSERPPENRTPHVSTRIRKSSQTETCLT